MRAFSGFKKMGFARQQRSFSQMNEIRRKRGAQQQKLREAREARRQEIAENAIARMQANASIFNIGTDASYTSIEQTLQQAQQRAIDAATASRSGLGQNANVSA